MMLLCSGSGKLHANGQQQSSEWIQELGDGMSEEGLDPFRMERLLDALLQSE
jgi:hypothetical protein